MQNKIRNQNKLQTTKSIMFHKWELQLEDEMWYSFDKVRYPDVRDRKDKLIWITMKNRDTRMTHRNLISFYTGCHDLSVSNMHVCCRDRMDSKADGSAVCHKQHCWTLQERKQKLSEKRIIILLLNLVDLWLICLVYSRHIDLKYFLFFS